MNKQKLGSYLEQWAENYLGRQGLKKITQNYRCYFGEIDLIMQDKEQLVFVEIRSKSNLSFGNAAESINFTKQKKIIKCASKYLSGFPATNYRFDVISLAIQINHQEVLCNDVEWIKNAIVVDKFCSY